MNNILKTNSIYQTQKPQILTNITPNFGVFRQY